MTATCYVTFGQRATDAELCGEPCSNSWHSSRSLGPYDCTPCQLPTGHKAAHWTRRPAFDNLCP